MGFSDSCGGKTLLVVKQHQNGKDLVSFGNKISTHLKIMKNVFQIGNKAGLKKRTQMFKIMNWCGINPTHMIFLKYR